MFVNFMPLNVGQIETQLYVAVTEQFMPACVHTRDFSQVPCGLKSLGPVFFEENPHN